MGRAIVAGGAAATKPLSGIMAATLAVGSSVYLMEDGSAVEYLVVNQGIPSASSLYDASCDGLWLLRKDIYENRAWSTGSNLYASASIHTYLNDTFINLFDTETKSAITQIKIPYVINSADEVLSGSNGLSTKIFLLSGYEVGFTTDVNVYFPVDGAKLDYFESGDTSDGNNRSLRIAYMNGTTTGWWTRSPGTNYTDYAWRVLRSGSCNCYGCSNSYGIRPALILPSTALFDKDTLILKGVA